MRLDWSLTFDFDDKTIADAGVPCPVPWCEAYARRRALCGDTAGAFYGGVHVARVRRFRNGRWRFKIQRELRRALPAVSDEAVAMSQMLHDSLNSGLYGPEATPELRRVRRARKRLGMEESS